MIANSIGLVYLALCETQHLPTNLITNNSCNKSTKTYLPQLLENLCFCTINYLISINLSILFIMRQLYLISLFLMFALLPVKAQNGWIWHSTSEGPVFDYTVNPGEPREYYDCGGPEKGMPDNLAMTIIQLKSPSPNYHLTIVFEYMDIGLFDQMKIYNGVIVLDNYPDEDGEYGYHWPAAYTPIFETKGTPEQIPFTVSSTSDDGCLSVAFQCNSNAPGWKGSIYCVKNGDPEPGGQTPEEESIASFSIVSNLGVDEDGYDIDECDIRMTLQGKQGDVIAIDCGYGNEEFTFANDEPASLTKTVDAGGTVTIYGNLQMLDLSGNRKVTAVNFNESPNLKVLRLSQNKVKELNLDMLTSLRELAFTDNKVENIDISNLGELEEFYGAWNGYQQLDTRHNPNLKVLTCYNTSITALNLEENTALQVLTAGGNTYTSDLDLSRNTELTMIDLEESGLTRLDLSNQRNLRKLMLNNNAFTSFELSELPKLEKLDLRNNQLDACAINDALIGLPTAAQQLEEQPQVLIARNPGAETAETDIAALFGWEIDQTGSGEGCATVRLLIESCEHGEVKTLVAGSENASLQPIAKGTAVEVTGVPEKGFELSDVFFNGVQLEDNRFEANTYGVVAAVFVKSSGIERGEKSQVLVKNTADGVVISGLTPGEAYTLYHANGWLVSRGIVPAEGEVVLVVERGGYIFKQEAVQVKLLK